MVSVLCGWLLSPTALLAEEPVGLILTWQQDPTTTMTIDWHTASDQADASGASVLYYKAIGSDDWHLAEGASHAFPFSDRTIHRVELTGLEPWTMYRFRVGEFERAYKFRTMPTDVNEQPLVFASGGDNRHRQEWMEQTNRVAMHYEPEFMVWGGDMAYDDGREDQLYRVYEFVEAMLNTMVTDSGRVIPVVVGIGNHEVQQGYFHRHEDDGFDHSDEWRERIAPYFFNLFAFPGHPGYNVLDFGDYMSLVMLDTRHMNPIPGEQTEWLEQVLQDRQHMPHVFPVYHVGAYPSARDYERGSARRIRQLWTPLFDEYGVRVAFENHDHTYKRTYPLRGDEIKSNGVVYLGDGAWGVETRQVHPPEETWYLARAESQRHAIIVTLHGPHQHFLMVNEDGDVIDEYPQTPWQRLSPPASVHTGP